MRHIFGFTDIHMHCHTLKQAVVPPNKQTVVFLNITQHNNHADFTEAAIVDYTLNCL